MIIGYVGIVIEVILEKKERWDRILCPTYKYNYVEYRDDNG
jgi:hypothetical protein